MGSDKELLRKNNRQRRVANQEQAQRDTYWSTHQGRYSLPEVRIPVPKQHRNRMCPSGLARLHPAGDLLLEYAMKGCPARTGRPWTKEEMVAAIDRGPHVSALVAEAIEQHLAEVDEKLKNGQARVVLWDDLKNNPPDQLKISPLAMVPHKSRQFRAILDLSFRLRLEWGGFN